MLPEASRDSRITAAIGPSYRIALGVAIVAGLFCFAVSILLLASYIQVRTVDPLESPALVQLLEELEENRDNAKLQEEIRALDLLMRKAYFTARWQVRTGGYLLLGGIIVLLASLKILATLRRRAPDPYGSETEVAEDPLELRRPARIVLAALGALLLGAGLVVSFSAETVSLPRVEQRAGEAAALTIFAKPSEGTMRELYRNWPSFRGPGGNGIATDTAAPVRWDGATGQGILWKTEIPLPGFNSPIVWEDRVFLSGSNGKIQEVYCFNSKSGEMLWQREVRTAGTPDPFPNVSSDTGYAAPSMATDGQRVFAIFTTGDIICFDFEGRAIWSRNLGVPDNHYGHSSSLITYGEALLVQYDHAGGPRMLALDTVSGNVLWETAREVQTSWASPIVVDTGSRVEVILNTNPIVASYDPFTGDQLWAVDCMMGEVAPSPAYAGDLVFAVNQNALLCAIDPASGSLIWEAEDDLPDVSSPLATEDYVFLLTSYGVVTCYDSKTGTVLWNHEFEQGFYSSPVLVGDLVYGLDMSGVTRIFEAKDEFMLVASPALGEKSMCTPAFTGGRIYIRGEKNLYCIVEGN